MIEDEGRRDNQACDHDVIGRCGHTRQMLVGCDNKAIEQRQPFPMRSQEKPQERNDHNQDNQYFKSGLEAGKLVFVLNFLQDLFLPDLDQLFNEIGIIVW